MGLELHRTNFVHLQSSRGLLRQSIDVDAMADAERPDFCLANGVFDEISAAQYEGGTVKPGNAGVEFARHVWQLAWRHQHVAPAQIDLLIQLQCHGHRGGRLGKFAIVGHDGAHARFSSRGKGNDGIAGMNNSACDAAGEAAKRGVGTNHRLHREAKTLQGIVFRKRDCLEVLQQRRTLIPRHPLAAVDDVVSLKRADRHALDVCDSQPCSERQEIVLQPEKDIFAIVGQVHLVHGGKYFCDSQGRSNEGETQSVREEPCAAVNQNDRQVRRGRAGRHVARVLLMPGRVGDDKFAARGREIPVRHVDGNALLAFGPQTIGEQRKIDWPRGAVDTAFLHRSELIFVDGLGIVQETANQRGLTVVNAPGGGEAKKLGVQVLLKKTGEGVTWPVLRGRNHQKYPSRFLSSMEASSSWSMARFSRSERRNETISWMICGTVPASERIAPVQGTHPRDLMRHFRRCVFSPGRSCAGWSITTMEPLRRTTSRSLAKYSGTIGIFSTWM